MGAVRTQQQLRFNAVHPGRNVATTHYMFEQAALYVASTEDCGGGRKNIPNQRLFALVDANNVNRKYGRSMAT